MFWLFLAVVIALFLEPLPYSEPPRTWRRALAWIHTPLGNIALVAVIALTIAPALAADRPTTTVIQLSPALRDELVNMGVAIILALGAAVWKWIDARSPLKQTQAEEIAREAFRKLLDKGAEYGATQMNGQLTKVGDIDVGSAALASGVNFVLTHGPDLAKRLGIDVETDEGRAMIAQSVVARLGRLLSHSAEPMRNMTVVPEIAPASTPAPDSIKVPASR